MVYNFKEKIIYGFYRSYSRADVGLSYLEQNMTGQISLRPLRLSLLFSLTLGNCEITI